MENNGIQANIVRHNLLELQIYSQNLIESNILNNCVTYCKYKSSQPTTSFCTYYVNFTVSKLYFSSLSKNKYFCSRFSKVI